MKCLVLTYFILQPRSSCALDLPIDIGRSQRHGAAPATKQNAPGDRGKTEVHISTEYELGASNTIATRWIEDRQDNIIDGSLCIKHRCPSVLAGCLYNGFAACIRLQTRHKRKK